MSETDGGGKEETVGGHVYDRGGNTGIQKRCCGIFGRDAVSLEFQGTGQMGGAKDQRGPDKTGRGVRRRV